MFKIKQLLALGALLILCASCGSQSKKGLKVAATAVPHAQMLEFVKPDLKAQGIDLVILVTSDYNMPNRALAEKEVDANFFQHKPFLDQQIQEFHYPIESIASIELEPMGLYSKKIHDLSDLPENAQVAIPNDPANEARALLLLQSQNLIQLDSSDDLKLTPQNITSNPKNLKLIEVDAAMLPRTLQDVDLAVINTNYALQAGLNPLKDALALESKDSPYANILVIRTGDDNRPDIQALKEALTSEKMKQFILDRYQGAVIPAF